MAASDQRVSSACDIWDDDCEYAAACAAIWQTQLRACCMAAQPYLTACLWERWRNKCRQINTRLLDVPIMRNLTKLSVTR